VIALKRDRWKFIFLCVGIFSFLSLYVHAQSEYGETPLGDVARSFRKKVVASDAVIDNDNLPKVVDDAETRRAAGASPTFSLDPGRKSIRVSSADVTCSLSFTGKTSAESDPALLDDLPRSELAKLDGPAILDGDSLQVSVHNGSAWELREVVIGLTIVKQTLPEQLSSSFGHARIVPTAAGGEAHSGQLPGSQTLSQRAQENPFLKQPDVTMLLRVKGTASPDATAVFRTALNFALFPDQEWHWAIVKAKGIPPQALPEATEAAQQSAQAGGVPPQVLTIPELNSLPRLLSSDSAGAH
jgi:hypothetical protein